MYVSLLLTLKVLPLEGGMFWAVTMTMVWECWGRGLRL